MDVVHRAFRNGPEARRQRGAHAPAGRAPDVSDVVYLASAALGPDGRLYVGGVAAGEAVGSRLVTITGR